MSRATHHLPTYPHDAMSPMKPALAVLSIALLLSLAATATPQTTPAVEPPAVAPSALAPLRPSSSFPVSALQPAQTILECERAIYILKTGYAQRWQTPEQYIEAFRKFTARGTSNDSLRVERENMIAYLVQSLPERHPMDEQTPLDVLVTRTIRTLGESRDHALAIEAQTTQ